MTGQAAVSDQTRLSSYQPAGSILAQAIAKHLRQGDISSQKLTRQPGKGYQIEHPCGFPVAGRQEVYIRVSPRRSRHRSAPLRPSDKKCRETWTKKEAREKN
ncbi:hypothetical protein TEQG_02799 [Trichophyton equinum CBS 127.97]|uniref:Uncharacterized protein n=1 Tax=Trichophyton equinum (strain ATCC MYA-4606 / CBS 127.97) TaxID=559882 RepID=F2PPE9_TRIEC|nr:hypothetical protein TEQG_02799 [Trichophyton equinum CBS 127.97]